MAPRRGEPHVQTAQPTNRRFGSPSRCLRSCAMACPAASKATTDAEASLNSFNLLCRKGTVGACTCADEIYRECKISGHPLTPETCVAAGQEAMQEDAQSSATPQQNGTQETEEFGVSNNGPKLDQNSMLWECCSEDNSMDGSSNSSSPEFRTYDSWHSQDGSFPAVSYQGGFFGLLPSPVSPKALPTIFEFEGADAQGGAKGEMDGAGCTPIPSMTRGPQGEAVDPALQNAKSRSSCPGRQRRFPQLSGTKTCARQGHTTSGAGQGYTTAAAQHERRLSPHRPLSSQLSPSCAALLSVLSESETPALGPGAECGVRPLLPRGHKENNSSGGSNRAETDNQGPEPVYPYRELQLSASLSALMAILSFEQEPESPPAGMPASRSLQKVGSGLEASLRELDMDFGATPLSLQRQLSLDSGVCLLSKEGTATIKGGRDPSPSGSLQPSPMQTPNASPCMSPARTRVSSVQSTPSPLLQRRITSNRNSAVQECWNAGPMRRDLADGPGLLSVTELIEKNGTAAFYRGFQTAGGKSPISPARSKRSRVGR